MMRASRTFFRFFGYSLLLIILYVFQGSGFIIPEIFGGRPLMLISLALCIASFENTLPSVIFGALCGVLTDISFDGSIGYFAFALTIVCYAENFVFSKYFVPSFVTVIVFSFAAVMTVMFTIAGMQQFQRQTTASHSAMTKLFQQLRMFRSRSLHLHFQEFTLITQRHTILMFISTVGQRADSATQQLT